jgi:hypothetical protein
MTFTADTINSLPSLSRTGDVLQYIFCNVVIRNSVGSTNGTSSAYFFGLYVAPTPTPTPTPTVQLCEQTGWINCGTVRPASGSSAWTLVADFRASGVDAISTVQSRILMPDGSVISTVTASLKSGTVNDGIWTATFRPIGGNYANGTGFKIQANAVNSLGGQSGWTLVTIYFINNSSTVNQNPR